MAKQIIWSPFAKEVLKNILLSSLEKHKNKQFGKTMYSLFQNALYRVSLNPFNGQATEIDNVRYVTPHPDYTLFYRHPCKGLKCSFFGIIIINRGSWKP